MVAPQGGVRLAGQLNAGEEQQGDAEKRERSGYRKHFRANQDVDRSGQACADEHGHGQVEQCQRQPDPCPPPDQAIELSANMVEPLGWKIEVGLAPAQEIGLVVELPNAIDDARHPVRRRDDQRARRGHEDGRGDHRRERGVTGRGKGHEDRPTLKARLNVEVRVAPLAPIRTVRASACGKRGAARMGAGRPIWPRPSPRRPARADRCRRRS